MTNWRVFYSGYMQLKRKHFNFSLSIMRSSMQFRITLGMWQMINTITMKMRTVTRLSSLFTFVLLSLWWDLKQDISRTVPSPLPNDWLYSNDNPSVEECEGSSWQETGEDDPAPVLVISKKLLTSILSSPMVLAANSNSSNSCSLSVNLSLSQ